MNPDTNTALLDALPAGVLLLATEPDGDYRILQYNRRAAELLGSGGPLDGATLRTLCAAQAGHWLAALGAPAGEDEAEVPGLQPGQTLSLARFSPAQGQLGVMIQDVSARRRVADSLVHQRALLRTVIDENPNIIILKDWEGRFLMANRALAQLYGTDPESMVGKDDGAYNPNAEQVEFYRRNVQEIMQRGQTEIVYESSTDAASGETRYFQSIKKPILGENGERSILVIANDITDVRRAQLQVEESEARLRHVMEATCEGVWDWHIPSGRLVHNTQWYTILGYREGELSGTLNDFVACLPEECRDEVLADVQTALVRGGRYQSEHLMVRRDGQRIWVLDRGAVVERDAKGAPVRMVGSFADITARRNMEDELKHAKSAAEAASAAKSAFLANMSHEIRTPLNGVIGMLELVTEGPLQAEQREFLQVAQRSAQTLLGLLSAVLDIARIESGTLELAQEPVELAREVDGVLAAHQAGAAAKGLSLAAQRAAQLPARLLGDPVRIRQVLDSLVDNAVKFSRQGRIDVDVAPATRAHLPDGRVWLRFEVRDQGIGIDAQACERVFQPFVQGDDSSTREFGGCGLGLALCQRLVGLMGGEIGVQSVPGQGSVFWFELPLQAVLDEAPAPVTGARPPRQGGGRRVLLVEDHPVNRMLATRILENAGFQVLIAEDGLAALECLAREAVALVLMDCHMPRMDGLEATRQLRAREAAGGLPRLPVLALTAYASANEEAACRAAGMDDFMGKPYSATDLLAMIDKHLSRSTPAADTPQVLPERESAPAGTVPARLDRALLSELQEALGDDLKEIVDHFLFQLDEQLGAIRQALFDGDAAATAAQAHSLKGSAGNLGAGGLSALSADIEQFAKRGELPAAAECFAQLEQCAARTVAELNAMGYAARAS